MSRNRILKSVQETLKSINNLEVDADSTLDSLDSLDRIQVAIDLEDKFEIGLTDSIVESWSCVMDIAISVDREFQLRKKKA